jgi:hypothetical protein
MADNHAFVASNDGKTKELQRSNAELNGEMQDRKRLATHNEFIPQPSSARSEVVSTQKVGPTISIFSTSDNILNPVNKVESIQSPEEQERTSREKIDEGKSEDFSHISRKASKQDDESKDEVENHAPVENKARTETGDTVLIPRPQNTNSDRNCNQEESKSKINRIPVSKWRAPSIAKYDLSEQVGKGTFGKVFKSKLSNPENEEEANKIFALKRLIMTNEEEGFPITALREILILKRLTHPNILELIEVAVDRSKESFFN